MKRLIDEETHPGTPEDLLARLLRSAPRFQPVPFRQQRVLARIRRPHRRGRVLLRTVVIAAVALSGVAAAAAAVERTWMAAPRSESLGLVAPPTPAQQTSRHPGRRPRLRQDPPSSAAEMTPPAVAMLEPPATAGEESGSRFVSAPPASPDSLSVRSPEHGTPYERSVAKVAPATTTPAAASMVAPSTPNPKTVADVALSERSRAPGGEDPAQVLEAIRALRGHRDAARATTLLDEYLQEHPNGVLCEDALAFSIEAADARHDRRAAAAYGERYLGQFPAGRFRAFALQAVERGTH